MDKISSITNNLVGAVPGIVYGDPSIVSDAKSGGALYLNGVNQWVDLGNQRQKCLGNLEWCPNGFTIALWLKMGTKSAAGTTLFYISSGGHTSASHGITMYKKNDILGASFRTKSRRWTCMNLMSVSNEVWYHVTLTWRADIGVKFFLNGCPRNMLQPCPSVSQIVTSTPYNNFILGSRNSGTIPNTYMGECYLDKMMVYEDVLDLHVIWSLFAGGVI